MSELGCTCYSSGSDDDCPKHGTTNVVQSSRFPIGKCKHFFLSVSVSIVEKMFHTCQRTDKPLPSVPTTAIAVIKSFR